MKNHFLQHAYHILETQDEELTLSSRSLRPKLSSKCCPRFFCPKTSGGAKREWMSKRLSNYIDTYNPEDTISRRFAPKKVEHKKVEMVG